MYSFGIGWACQAPDKTCFLMPYTVWHERWRKCCFSKHADHAGTLQRFVWLTSEVKVTRLGERRHLICLWRLLKTCPGVLMRMSFEHFEDEACGGCDTVGGGSFVVISSCFGAEGAGKSLRWHWGYLRSLNTSHCHVNAVGRFWWSSKRDYIVRVGAKTPPNSHATAESEDYSTAYKNQREGTLGPISTYSSLAV